jgi:hypothetical protein
MSQRLVRVRTASGQFPIYPALPPWLAFAQGNQYFVHAYLGNDANDGRSPDKACKTVKHVHDNLMTANQNDVCFLLAASNTSAATTDYQSTMLTWSKDLCHLVGVNNGISLGSRSRIAAISTWTSANPLMTLSGDGCYIAGVSLWMLEGDGATESHRTLPHRRNGRGHQ